MIERTRKRPRVRSVSFKTLGWLIRREASYNVYIVTYRAEESPRMRAAWCKQPTRWIVAKATRLIRNDPGRRYYP